MATFIAHDLEDGDWVEVGANLPVPRAGALLAHLTHGPNLIVMMAMTKAYLRDEPVIADYEFITDTGAMRWAEGYYQHDVLLSHQKHRSRGVFYCGGIQIDRYGNSNMIGIGKDIRSLAFRGPGAIGTCNATVQCKRWHLVTTTHDPRVLVDQVDFVSALGYGRGEPRLRAELGLPNDGPKYIITPLCIFDFHPETRRARLKSIHPNVDPLTVVERTGFEFEMPTDPPVTTVPSDTELAILRNRIDSAGSLQS